MTRWTKGTRGRGNPVHTIGSIRISFMKPRLVPLFFVPVSWRNEITPHLPLLPSFIII